MLVIIKKTHLSRMPQAGSVSIAMICLLFLMLVNSVFWKLDPVWRQKVVATQSSVFAQGEIGRLLISPYVHSDLKHLMANASMFFVLAIFIYGYFGAAPLLILSFPLAAVIEAVTLKSYPPDVGLLGISGVVYAMCGFWLVLYLFIDRRRSFWKRLLRGMGFTFAVLLPTTFEPQVSYTAHAVGFAVGLLYGLIHFAIYHQALRAAEVFELDEGSGDLASS